MITVTCPKCNVQMNCDDTAAGMTVKCPTCQSDVFVPAAAPAAPAAPAFAPAAPCAGGSGIAFAGIGVAVIALIVAAVALICVFFCGGSADEPWNFCKDPEAAAKYALEKQIEEYQTRQDAKGYFFQKFGKDYINNAEWEVMEDGNYAVVFYKTKVQGVTKVGLFQMKKNSDEVYILGELDNDVPSKFAERVAEKAVKYGKDDEKLDYEDIKPKK